MEEQSNVNQSYAFTPETTQVPYQSLPDRLRDIARIHPEREAIVFITKDGDRSSIQYNELYDQSKQVAKGLIAIGIRANDVVGISHKNCIESAISIFGVQMAGAIPLLFFFQRHDGADIGGFLREIPNCVALIIDPGHNDVNIEICQNLFSKVNADGTVSSEILAGISRIVLLRPSNKQSNFLTVNDLTIQGQSSTCHLPFISPDNTATIFLTSGTTGTPKAVPQTHTFLIRCGINLAKNLKLDLGDRFFNNRPFTWIAGYPTDFLSTMSTKVTASDITALKAIEEINNFTAKIIETENCTSALIIVSYLYDMLYVKLPPCTKWPLKAILTGGGPVGQACISGVGTLAETIVAVYGGTEFGFASSLPVSNANDFEDYCIGYPEPGFEMKIVNDDGNIVPKGTHGEIYIRSRDRFQGYLNKKSDCSCTKGGWYKTDDEGFMTEKGRIFAIGRKSDMMIIDGKKVSPTNLENLIKLHPEVSEAFVYPVHDEEMFQRVRAAVVLKTEGSLTGEDLKNYIAQQQNADRESYWFDRTIPQHFIFLQSLPRTHTGKLDRKACAVIMKTYQHLYS